MLGYVTSAHLMAFYAVGFSGMAALGALVWVMRWRSRRWPVRNPLTRDLLRSPGHSLREQLEDLNLDIVADGVSMIVMFWIVPATALLAAHRTGREVWGWVTAAALGGTLLYFGMRIFRNLSRRERLRLGLDAELATGEELNRLMQRGCHVFHDVPADGFNIDHVVVGPAGVFAVETKARAKPRRGRGRQDATVHYDGNTLCFPRGEERRSLEQAKRQARWLSTWLSSATGEPVGVNPALALPGWWVERRAAGDVLVFNPRNAEFLSEVRDSKELSGQQIQRVVHQLEQRCRDVEPRALNRMQRVDPRSNKPQ